MKIINKKTINYLLVALIALLSYSLIIADAPPQKCNLVEEDENRSRSTHEFCSASKDKKLIWSISHVGRYLKVVVKNRSSNAWTLVGVESIKGCCNQELVGTEIKPQGEMEYFACTALDDDADVEYGLECKLKYQNNADAASTFDLSVTQTYPPAKARDRDPPRDQCPSGDLYKGIVKVASSNETHAVVKQINNSFFCGELTYHPSLGAAGKVDVEIKSKTSPPSTKQNKKVIKIKFDNKNGFELAQTQIINSIIAAELPIGADNTRPSAVTNFKYELNPDRKTLTYIIEFNQ